jgi:hypothetical protein
MHDFSHSLTIDRRRSRFTNHVFAHCDLRLRCPASKSALRITSLRIASSRFMSCVSLALAELAGLSDLLRAQLHLVS